MTEDLTEQRDRLLRIPGATIGPGHPTFFVVEEGQANNGNHPLALQMVQLAARTGANAIEFQFAIADDFYVRSHPNHALYRSREFSTNELQAIREAAHDAGLAAVATPLSEKLVEPLAKAGYALFDINSSDIVNPRMLDAVSSSGVPFFVGTAMASIEEIDRAVDRLMTRTRAPFALLHGQHIMATAQGYGVPVSELSLSSIRYLADRYGIPVGFTDHSPSRATAAFAVAYGAVAVTKHLAPAVGWRGPDWQICLTPEEMAECVSLVRLSEAARGTWEKSLAFGELADRVQMRRSVVAATHLPAHTKLAAEYLVLKRPGTGIGSMELERILGRELRADVEADEEIRWENLIDSRSENDGSGTEE